MKLLTICLLLVLYNCQSDYCCQKNTLSIIGAGTVTSQPDIAQFTVTATATASTSAAALSKVNTIINQVSVILTAKGLPKSNYTTQGINLYPQYNYTDAGVAILTGQQASINLAVTVGNLLQNKPILGLIVTALSNVNNITISGLTFSNSDTTLVSKLARKAAVADALAKAQQYSTLSGKILGSVKQIIDQNSDNYSPVYSDFNLYSFKAQSLPVPFGQVTASATVQINWNLSY